MVRVTVGETLVPMDDFGKGEVLLPDDCEVVSVAHWNDRFLLVTWVSEPVSVVDVD